MRALRQAVLAVVAAALGLSCGGGLENEPLTLGVVRGTLVASTSSSTVSVIGRPELLARPDADGSFELVGVPQGPVELLAIISTSRNERVQALVRGGQVTDIGTRSGRPTATIEVELQAPSHQRVSRGTVDVPGTPVEFRLDEPGEWKLRVPAGCYQVTASVPGLGTQSASNVCVSEGQERGLHLSFPDPDGSPGREGCVVTGCESGYSCRSSTGACVP